MVKVYFISGHLDLTLDEWTYHYLPALNTAREEGARFVVGDARGTDLFAQHWLKQRGCEVTVFHMFTEPRNNVGGFPTQGGYTSDDERDAAMTAASDADIAWVRPGRERSGTAKNQARRGRS